MTSIRNTAALTAVLVYALIVLGAVVRSTNSGLSCPDWPTCYGHWVPLPGDIAAVPNLGYSYGQVMLEWVHRLIAGVLVGPLVLLLAVLTFRHRRVRPELAVAGGALVLLLLLQAALGGLTVLDLNSAWSVAIHLGNALLVLAVVLRIVVLSAGWTVAGSAGRLVGPAALAFGLALLAMMSAAMTAKSGASLACATWPSCNGALIPDLGDYFIRIHFAHRVLAAATGVTILLLLWRGLTLPALPRSLRLTLVAAALLVVTQIGLGALIIMLEVPVPEAVLHQAIGVLTFATITLVLWRCAPTNRAAELGDADGLALRGA